MVFTSPSGSLEARATAASVIPLTVIFAMNMSHKMSFVVGQTHALAR